MEKRVQFDEKWSSIKPVVLKILYQEPVNQFEWQDLFSEVYRLCIWDDYEIKKLEKDLQNIIMEFIQKVKKVLSVHQEDQALLKAYIAEWRKFFHQCTFFPFPFKHFESALYGNKITNHKKREGYYKSTLQKFMLDKWNQYIFHNIRERLQDTAMNLVYLERIGEAFDSQLVIGLKESIINICEDKEDPFQIYKKYYEALYIEKTESFYKIKASEYLEVHGILKYMQYANNKIWEEDIRAQRYLEKSGAKILSEHCALVLVSNFRLSILAECTNIFKRNDIETLSLLFKLMNYVPHGISEMIEMFGNYILSEGLAVMNTSSKIITQNSEKYVEQLLLLFDKFSSMIHQGFGSDPRFLTSRDIVYKQIVNDTTVFRLELPTKQNSSKYPPESKSPELLANFCDMLLRVTPHSKTLTSDEIDNKLNDVLLVLKYVQNKDVFMRFHVAHLTRRLLLNTSADFDKEENMISGLRDIGMPAEYINKLQRMFQDIKVSEDLNQQFKNVYRNTKGKFADSINIKILNMGAWSRSSERASVILPLELEEIVPEIESFYKMNHSGRKLHWYHHMSNGTIIFTNDVGKFEIDATTFQMAILFVWNERPNDKISFEDLKVATGLPNPELKRTLLTLVAFSKFKKQILNASCSPNEFNDSTTFWINDEFCLVKHGKSQKRGKASIIGRLQLSTENSKSEDNKYILQLRELRVQEATIKIMKMRKSISNMDLHTELINMLKNMFIPSKHIIKGQIEWLIEKQYMERDKNDMNKFVYIA